MILAESDAHGAASLVYHLTYVDGEGSESVRIVTLRRIDPTSDGLKLFCWCHSAQANRQFRVDRIREVFCVTSGEVYDAPAQYFVEHPMLADPRDPEAYALAVCRHEVNLLTIVAAADGILCEDEQERILIHVYDRMAHVELDEGLLRRRLAKIVPDTAAFEAAMIRMGRFRDGDASSLMRTMRKLVDADGRIAPEEMTFVSEIQTRLAGVLSSAAAR